MTVLLKAPQADCLAALQKVLGIVERRHTLPVLAHVLLRKAGARLEFTTSDLDLQLRTSAELGGDDKTDFATTVSARKLHDILRALPAEQVVTLATRQQQLTLQAGKSRFSLQTLPAADFPLAQEAIDFGPACTLAQAVLKRLLDQVAFAMAAQDIRYYLNGMLLVADGNTLTAVATDGNRLALAQAPLPQALPARQHIVPRKAVLELQRLLRSDDTALEMQFSARQARFRLNDTEFVCKLVEGRFPDYQRVIPPSRRNLATAPRGLLLASLQRAAILTSDRFKGVRLHLEPGLLRISASNAEREEADVEMEMDYAGENIEIGLNISYLLDLLANSDSEAVQLALQDAHASVLFTFPGREGFNYVVSPMRL